MKGMLKRQAMKKNSGVLFPFTVEMMDAIVAGLNPQTDEKILAISGCGDQVFALLEKGAYVTAVDVNQSQLDLLKRRRDALFKDDFSGFYGTPTITEDFPKLKNRIDYFEAQGRYERLKTMLDRLEISPAMSLEEMTAKRVFRKIYASDAVGELYCENPLQVHLIQIARGIETGGLLYLSNGPEIDNLVNDISTVGLELVPELTTKSRAKENLYVPNVYRRMTS